MCMYNITMNENGLAELCSSQVCLARRTCGLADLDQTIRGPPEGRLCKQQQLDPWTELVMCGPP